MSEDVFPTTSAATSSSVSIEVNVGDLITIGVQDDGFAPFGGVLFSTLNLTNLQFIVPGFESDVTGFINSWGLVRAEDKTPPTVVAPVAPTNLFCDQINGITLTELNFNTSRCYRTNNIGQFINAQGVVVPVTSLPLDFRSRIIAGGGFPTISDGCSNVRVCVNDVITFATGPNADEQCNPVTLTRTFTATDDGPCTLGNGEVSAPTVVSYSIIFAVPTLADVTGNMLAREVSCSDPMNLLPANQFGNANPAPRPQDFPFITTSNGPVPITGSFCNLAVTVQDGPRTVTCPQTYKFFRTFTVLNWCTPNAAPLIFTRLVKVGDFNAPVITAPTQDLNFDGVADAGLFFSTNALGCLSFFQVPNVVVTDNCSLPADITVLANIFPNQNLNATPIGSFLPGQTTSGIPQGTHTLRYTAVDPCDNASFIDVTIVIDDATAPVAKCEDGLNISIGGSPDNMGVAIISAEDIDKNSYDECSGVTLAIACIDTTDNSLLDPILGYQPTITVDCGDLGRKGISLRVTDAAGNVNFCWLTVLIEDKATPICIPPTPRQILCSDLPFDFPANVGLAFGLDQVNVGALLSDLFGSPFAQDNCPNAVTAVLTPVDTRDNCGIGTIVRSFRVTDAQGLASIGTCSQTIVVLEQHDYTIKFPGDSDSENCDLDPVSLISFTERACDLIAVSVHPDTFAATATECYKIRNTIEVINWCEYDGIEEPITLPRDADGDNNLTEDFWLHVVPSVNLNSINDDRAFLDRDANRLNGIPSYINDLAGFPITGVVDPTPPINADATGNGYGTDARRGYFRYVQFVKVYDGVAPTIDTTGNQSEFCSFDGALCAGDLELSFTVDDACSPDAISIVSVTVDPFVIDANNDGIITAVEFMAGPLPTTASVSVSFVNNNIVITGTSIPIGRHAIRVEILDGCGNRAAVIYVVEIIDCKAPTPICINGLTATLMPDGNGGGMAAIWASDFIASPSTDCTPDVFFTIYRSADAVVNNFAPVLGDTGLILTCPDLGLLPVRIYTTDGAGNFDFCETTLLVQENQASITCGAGVGSIAGLIATEGGASVVGAEVAVSGSSNETMVTSNGTYSFSLPMGGDYTVTPQLDANHLNGVSTFDLVLISKHILGIQEFTSPYLMVAADANNNGGISTLDLIAIRRLILGLDNAFTSNTSWRFFEAGGSMTEVHNFNNLNANVTGANFIGVKIGDVNGSATANLIGATAEERSNGSVELRVDEMELVAGNTYTVDVRAGDLAGFQGTLALNGAELINLTYAAATAENFGTQLADAGMVTMSFNSEVATDEQLFSVTLLATADAKLSEVLSLTDRATRTEGYSTTGDIRNLVLNFGSTTVATEAAFELMQNTPNPFAAQTEIRFNLPVAADATLTVQDVTGKVVLVRSIEANAGFNKTVLSRREVGAAAGVLTYTLTAGEFTATRKMIVQ